MREGDGGVRDQVVAHVRNGVPARVPACVPACVPAREVDAARGGRDGISAEETGRGSAARGSARSTGGRSRHGLADRAQQELFAGDLERDARGGGAGAGGCGVGPGMGRVPDGGDEGGAPHLGVAADKRWRDGQEVWMPPTERFDPRGFAVDGIADDGPAKAFVTTHHYAHSYPSARFRVGLWGPGPALVGVAVFSHPASDAVLTKWTGVARARDAVELGRFVCLDAVRFNGETWFLARAFRLLRAHLGVTRVLSFADPLERRTAGGVLCKPAHRGTIYMAHNGLLAGRSGARTLLLTRDGAVLSARAIEKVRAEDRGWEYAMRQLLAAGVPARRPGETLAGWARRAVGDGVREGALRRVRHPGNFAYTFGLTGRDRAALARLHVGGCAYPARARPGTVIDRRCGTDRGAGAGRAA